MGCENEDSRGKTPAGGDNRPEDKKYSNYYIEPVVDGDIYTPTNITGMYRRIISGYLAGTNYSKTKVLPALNKEQSPDHGDSLIVVKRGSLSDSGLGIKGKSERVGILPAGLPGADRFSGADSKSMTHLQNLSVDCTVYGENLAEIEAIGYIVYKLILAYSNDILSKYTPGIKNVTSPTLSEAVPSKKHTNRFECYINFNVSYIDETILLMSENMIKYLNITVSEDSSVNTVIKRLTKN